MGGTNKKSEPKRIQRHEKKEAIRKRELVNKLYFEYGVSKREIARREEVSREFVKKWTQSEDLDFTMDQRGWEKGRRRKWDEDTIERIVQIRKELEEDSDQDYWGPTAVEVEYRKRFPEAEVPPLRTIGQILKDLGLTKDQRHSSKRGALRYLRYPEKTIYRKIGGRVLEADFVGDKYIKGRSKPLRFIGFSFKRKPELRHFELVEGETTDEFISHTKAFFDRFETPEVMKMDNSPATVGGGNYKRIISRSTTFLLENEVYPVFSVPRIPASQASIEGSNSVFSRKFWKRHEFDSIQQMQERLKLFNKNTREYKRYEPPKEEEEKREEFEPAVYFIRQVREKEEEGEGYIDVMNENVEMPREYIRYFMLGEWKLPEEKLLVRFERRKKEGKDQGEIIESEVIKEVDFPIHEASKERCKEVLAS